MTPLLAQHLRTDRSFERMYRRYVADVYHYALAICRNETDAEDVTQTTFMNAYRAVQAGERPRTPKNWLIAIAHNVCRQRFRQAARRPSEVELDDGVAAFVPEDVGPSAEDIRRALGELAFNQRAALVMRELEGRSYAEIAEILSISVSAVETLIFRARRALREQLEESLTCRQAELALSKQLDGRLPRAEKGALRAHLRSCSECASFARSQRAQRSALRSLAAVPLPSSLASLFGGGGAAVGSALATKAAAVTALGLLATGVGVETAVQHPWRAKPARPTAAATAADVAARAPTQLVAQSHKPTASSVSPRPSDYAKRQSPRHERLSGSEPQSQKRVHSSHVRRDGAVKGVKEHPNARSAKPGHALSKPAHPLTKAAHVRHDKPATTRTKHEHAHGAPAAGHGKSQTPPGHGSSAGNGNGHGKDATPPGQTNAQPAPARQPAQPQPQPQPQPAQAQPEETLTLPLIPVQVPKPRFPKP